jgi:hypothetical protein
VAVPTWPLRLGSCERPDDRARRARHTASHQRHAARCSRRQLRHPLHVQALMQGGVERLSQPSEPSNWAHACQARRAAQGGPDRAGSLRCPHLLDCARHGARGARQPAPHAVRAVRHCPAQPSQHPALVAAAAAAAAGAAPEGAVLPLLPRPRGGKFIQPAVGPQELKKVGGVCMAGRADRVCKCAEDRQMACYRTAKAHSRAIFSAAS